VEIQNSKEKKEDRERKVGKCKREAERGSWGRKTRKIDVGMRKEKWK
jgi:hypothetical protein